MRLSKETKRRLIEERDLALDKMSMEGITEDEWNYYKKQYEGYSEMLKCKWKISPDTLLIVGGNLLGILLILNFEKADIITSKALSFVLKGRV